MTVVSAYAPHSGYPFDTRQKFFHDLGLFAGSFSTHGPLLLYGDFNSKLHHRFAGEEHIMGPYVYESACLNVNAEMNRFLLTEICEAHGLAIGNTFFELPLEKLITNYNV
jgi:hypothetical protein